MSNEVTSKDIEKSKEKTFKLVERRYIIILIFLIVSSLLMSIYLHINNHEYESSILANLFAGMITGLIIAIIQALKNKRKFKLIILKTAYQTIFDGNLEFLNYILTNNIYDDNEAFKEYSNKKFHLLLYNIQHIMSYKNEILKEGELEKIFKEEIGCNLKEKETLINEIISRVNVNNEKYNNKLKSQILDEIKKYDFETIKLSCKIQGKIDNCKSEIALIEKSII